MKKLCIALSVIVGSALLLGGCGKRTEGIVSAELIETAKNAQYLPSAELLVANQTDGRVGSLSAKSGELSPEILRDGGFSRDEYDELIESISPIDTPFNRDFTVSDAKNEVVKVLSQGVIFDEWFTYEEGELQGYGKYYVSDEEGVLTVTRLSSFQPWVYDAESGKFLSNEDFPQEEPDSPFDDFDPNYPIRSDNYLRISIYGDRGKEVVECEVAENLSYYNEVTPVSYQFMRNVKDTSFTKIQITLRDTIPSEAGGSWGYDIDTDLPYGYMRSFTQLDYSSPDDIQWLEATQHLPYAFCNRAQTDVQYGCRSAEGGFSYRLQSIWHEGEFSYQPSEEYLTIRLDDVVNMTSVSRLSGWDMPYDKDCYQTEEGIYYYTDAEFNAEYFTEERRSALNTRVSSAVGVLKSLAGNGDLSAENLAYDCAAKNTSFEKAFDAAFASAAKAAIDGSRLAKDYLNNDVYLTSVASVIPVAYVEKNF